jgi:hypothetical protein
MYPFHPGRFFIIASRPAKSCSRLCITCGKISCPSGGCTICTDKCRDFNLIDWGEARQIMVILKNVPKLLQHKYYKSYRRLLPLDSVRVPIHATSAIRCRYAPRYRALERIHNKHLILCTNRVEFSTTGHNVFTGSSQIFPRIRSSYGEVRYDARELKRRIGNALIHLHLRYLTLPALRSPYLLCRQRLIAFGPSLSSGLIFIEGRQPVCLRAASKDRWLSLARILRVTDAWEQTWDLLPPVSKWLCGDG